MPAQYRFATDSYGCGLTDDRRDGNSPPGDLDLDTYSQRDSNPNRQPYADRVFYSQPDTAAHRDGQPNHNTDRDLVSNGDCYCQPDRERHGHPNRDPYCSSNGNGTTDCHTHPNRDPYCQPDINRAAYRDAHCIGDRDRQPNRPAQ